MESNEPEIVMKTLDLERAKEVEGLVESVIADPRKFSEASVVLKKKDHPERLFAFPLLLKGETGFVCFIVPYKEDGLQYTGETPDIFWMPGDSEDDVYVELDESYEFVTEKSSKVPGYELINYRAPGCKVPVPGLNIIRDLEVGQYLQATFQRPGMPNVTERMWCKIDKKIVEPDGHVIFETTLDNHPFLLHDLISSGLYVTVAEENVLHTQKLLDNRLSGEIPSDNVAWVHRDCASGE